MTYLLRLDTSPRHDTSFSRDLADALEAQIKSEQDIARVVRRDLTEQEVPHIAQDTILGYYTPKEDLTPELSQAVALSDELIAELKEAKALLISAPMYNFTLPSSLKAWVDRIVRINETFSFDGETFSGLVDIQTAYLALSYGAAGYGEGGAMRSMNYLEPYLRSLLSFIGISTVHAFEVEGTTADTEVATLAQRAAMGRVSAHFSKAA